MEQLIGAVASRPLDPSAHLALARGYAAAGRWMAVLGVARTARALGAADEGTAPLLVQACTRLALFDQAQGHLARGPGADTSGARRLAAELRAAAERGDARDGWDFNRVLRWRTLADHVHARCGRGDVRVLDVGGGEGGLAAFLPEAAYVLVEPTVNGLSGTGLPFPGRSFDAVVACHVLEHVPEGARGAFLDQLAARARRALVLLNPFRHEGLEARPRHELVYDASGNLVGEEHDGDGDGLIDDLTTYTYDCP